MSAFFAEYLPTCGYALYTHIYYYYIHSLLPDYAAAGLRSDWLSVLRPAYEQANAEA